MLGELINGFAPNKFLFVQRRRFSMFAIIDRPTLERLHCKCFRTNTMFMTFFSFVWNACKVSYGEMSVSVVHIELGRSSIDLFDNMATKVSKGCLEENFSSDSICLLKSLKHDEWVGGWMMNENY